MKSTELRIGNYLQGSNPIIVTKILHDGWVKIEDSNSSFQVEGEFPCFKPIPLTEEWLVKFGFERSGLYNLRNDVYIYDEYGLTNTGFEYRYNYSSITIKYVHQLQNLYFALTGEELIYTP